MTNSCCTLVIPCFNEEKRFRAAAFSAFLQTDVQVRLLFVNDGSGDGTLDLLRQFCREHPDRAEVLDLQPNGGKGEAVRRGMLHAMEVAPDLDNVGFWDADLATPLAAYPDFVAVLNQRPLVEMVFGARIRLLGRHVHRNPARHYAGRAFATAVSLTLRLPIYDSQCGAKVFRATPALRGALAKPFTSRWIFDVEILARFLDRWNTQGIVPEERIYELPLETWVDVAGSKVGPKDFLRSFTDLVKIRGRHPR